MSAIRLSHGEVLWQCDRAGCEEQVRFRAVLGGDPPQGWEVDTTTQAGHRGRPPFHYCPEHAPDRA